MEFGGLNDNTYQWTVNLPASTGAVAFAITDNEGNEAYTDEVSPSLGCQVFLDSDWVFR